MHLIISKKIIWMKILYNLNLIQRFSQKWSTIELHIHLIPRYVIDIARSKRESEQ